MSAKKTGKLLSRSISIDNSNKIKIACVISEWHNEITESFYNGALNKFSQYGVLENNVDKVYVPGSFELIYATKNLINKDYDAIISMGCIIKGDLKYGAKRSNKDGSICLHARKLSFVHPVKKETVEIVAPVPNDNLWKAFETSHS